MGTKIKLGDVARDRITGLEGVVVAETQWLHGCRRLTIQPQFLHEGKMVDTASFDEPQVLLVRSARDEERRIAEASRRTGGPRPEPVRR